MSRVALIGENSFYYVNELIDIWNSGNCAVLIDWRIPITTALQMMEEAEVSECRIERGKWDDMLDKIATQIEIRMFGHEVLSGILPEFLYDKFREIYSNDEAVIIYSSGTTGKSKGIILTHYAINTNADSIIDYMKPCCSDTIYIVKALSHSSTLVGELLVGLKTRTKVLFTKIVVPPRYILSNISKYNVTILCVNPTLLSMYADECQRNEYKLSSLRVVYVSGSILNENTQKTASEVFTGIDIYNVYGLSEAGPRVTAQRFDCCKGNSVGKPIKFVEIAIVNENGVKLNNGDRGIIFVNTPCRLSGYVTGNEKNSSIYKNWLNTGDVGYIDENDELFVVGRLDDVIIINSHKIYPSDIEKTIITYTGVTECVVVKFEVNNNVFIGCMYSGIKHKVNIIKCVLKKRLLPYEIPHCFIHTEKIPKNKNGKIIKKEVIRLFESLNKI